MLGYLIALAIGGLIVGAFARLALPGKDPMTLLQTMLVGIGGSFADQDTKRIALQLDVNLRATLVVTRESLPLLRAARGQVITLASIAGTIPTPGLAVYGATKAALIAWTRSLNREEEAHGAVFPR